VLLLDHDRDALERLFGGTSLDTAGPNAPRDVGELAKRIATARRRGYAAVVEESEPGLCAVAAPIRDYRGFIVAALNISAPAFRFKQRLNDAGERIAAVAEELSRIIGWPPTGEPESVGARLRGVGRAG
jgi:DNA-binding IclR family transcriptional regulator